MVLPTVAAANGGRRPISSPRRINIRNRSNNKNNSNKLNISGLSLLVFVVILLWASIVLVSPRLIYHQANSNSYLNNKMQGPPLQHHNTKKKKKKKKKGGLLNKLLHHAPINRGRLGSSLGNSNHYSSSIPPRVVGMYAYPINNESKLFTEDNKKNRNDMRNYLPQYKYITERISPYLLSKTSETLRRIRHHDYFAQNTPLQDFVYNYKMAISGNSDSYQIKSEDPLKHLMIDSDSRDMLRSIEEDSEDYEGSMAEPLNNEECEATPQQEAWMVHAKSTCNYIHENDMYSDIRHQKTKLLGNGYWRDVWPVYDSEPSTLKAEKKVALKTIRWEHDYDERNFHRHVRDAIVSERLTSSPRVTSIFAFCGNSGYYDFAGGGSLADRLEKHWEALDDADNKEETGKHDSKDVRLLDQRTKLSLAHDMATALADLHDADGMKDANGDIISASMVHADITTDQFIIIDGNWKLNDFNRCRFMRRQRNTGPETGDGDGKPCGFQVGNNPGKGRSPEEYKYQEETEKVDVYSLGNVFYTIFTDEIPFDDVGSKQAVKDIKNGIRAEIPPRLLTSEDPVDIALRTVVDQAWQQEPHDRPRARALAGYLAKELEKIDKDKIMSLVLGTTIIPPWIDGLSNT